MAQETRADSDNGKKRVLIVDDHPLVREWLAALINQQSDLQVCGEAASASEGIQLVATAKPDVTMVDISMEGGSGIELIKHIKATCPVSRKVEIIVLSMHDEAVYCERALRAGARGYITKREATKNVLQGIRCVLDGKLYLSQKVALLMAEKLLESKATTADAQAAARGSQVELLSDRELEVFQLLGRGLSTRRIAEELHISVKTVQAIHARIKEKLRLSSATELLREAVRWHDREQET